MALEEKITRVRADTVLSISKSRISSLKSARKYFSDDEDELVSVHSESVDYFD